MDNDYFYRTDLNGNLITFHFPQGEQLGLVMGQDGDLYFNRPNGDIVKIGYDDDTGARHVIGKGYLMKDNAYIKNDVIWFTDGEANYAIYKLQNGKKRNCPRRIASSAMFTIIGFIMAITKTNAGRCTAWGWTEAIKRNCPEMPM